jgi:hypothetical protein
MPQTKEPPKENKFAKFLVTNKWLIELLNTQRKQLMKE